MISAPRHQPDPTLDLVLQRDIDVPPPLVWRAWTTPDLLKQWFTPAPWATVDSEVDLRPGGIFRTTMRSPEGQEFPSTGCILEALENERLAWTAALLPGFRPLAPEAATAGPLLFSAIITLEPRGAGTRYTATVIHADAASSAKHAEMGFHQGWGAALDQLVALMRGR